jgi:hypothetical protein
MMHYLRKSFPCFVVKLAAVKTEENGDFSQNTQVPHKNLCPLPTKWPGLQLRISKLTDIACISIM